MHDMTNGSVRRHVIRMTLFILAGLTLQTLSLLVDTYWVSRLGKQAVAAVTLSGNLWMLSLAATQMLSVGCVAIVSHAAGRKDQAEVERKFNQALSLCAGVGIAFLGGCVALMGTYADRIAGDAETAALARRFLTYFIPALSLQFATVGLDASLRAIGIMKPGLLAQAAAVLLNMILAPFLIFGWIGGHPMGVAGAGLATLLAQLVAAAGLFAYIVRGATPLRIRLGDWRPDLGVWRRILTIGGPSGAEFGLMAVGFGVTYVVIRPFGSAAQAGYGITTRITQAGFMPVVAISLAVAAVAGQNFGASAFRRVRETFREGAKLAIGAMLIFTLLCHFAPVALIEAFSEDANVIEVGADCLRTISYSFVASGIVMIVSGTFQGMGNTWPSLLASTTRSVIYAVSVLWLAQQSGFEIHTVWIIAVAAVAVQIGLASVLLRRELGIRAPVDDLPRAKTTPPPD